MKLYDVTVLLHGEILFQVPKTMVTAAEIRMLRGIHTGNNDPVTNIKTIGETNRSDAAERARLANLYGQDAFSLDGEVSTSGTTLVNSYFPPGVPLPQEVPPQLMDNAKDYRPLDEAEEIVLFGDNGEPIKIDASPVESIMQSSTREDDPFAEEREAGAAAPKLEPTSTLGLRSARRTTFAPGA